jgi:hypothetical protein
MAKYLSMTSVPAEELEELKEEYSWDAQAVAALATIEQFHGDLVAVIRDVAAQTGVKAEELLKAADDRCKAVLRDDDVTEDLPDMVNSITTGVHPRSYWLCQTCSICPPFGLLHSAGSKERHQALHRQKTLRGMALI